MWLLCEHAEAAFGNAALSILGRKRPMFGNESTKTWYIGDLSKPGNIGRQVLPVLLSAILRTDPNVHLLKRNLSVVLYVEDI